MLFQAQRYIARCPLVLVGHNNRCGGNRCPSHESAPRERSRAIAFRIVHSSHPVTDFTSPDATLFTYLDNHFARGCGLVTVRQRPGTVNGAMFTTLKDKTGR